MPEVGPVIRAQGLREDLRKVERGMPGMRMW